MAIRGSLSEASLPDVLQLLALGHKTGCLSVADRSNLGYIFFEGGRICFASIVNRRDRLGDLLVKSGKLSRQDLDAAVAQQDKERDRKLGEILIERGTITANDLQGVVRLQVEEAVYFLFTWTQGTFQFDADVRPEGDVLLSINPESLLLEGARRVDEWSLIEKKIPSMDIVFAVDGDRARESDVDLTLEQEKVLELLDGRRSMTQIVEESGLNEFDAGKAVYGLITAGFARRVSQSTATVSEGSVEARVEEHRNLGVAFYRTGMLDEAEREFRRVVELKGDEASAHAYLGLVAVKKGEWADAEGAFRRSITVGGAIPHALYNLALVLEQRGQLAEAESSYGDAAGRARRDARVLTGWGIAALRLEKFDEAAGRLDRAREVADGASLPAAWYWAQSLLLAVAEKFDEAEQVLRDGLEHHGRSGVLRNNLAALLELQGRTEECEQILRAAAAEGIALPQLSKNLGDLLYRAGLYDDAWDAYQRAVKAAPTLGDDVYFKLGNIAYKRMDHATASAMWHRTIELNPKHQLARTNIDTMSALR